MKRKISVLIVDNRPMVIQGIKTSLMSEKIILEEFKVDVAFNYNEVMFNHYHTANRMKQFDLIIIDIDIVKVNPDEIHIGEDYVANITALYPDARIITIIRKENNYRINRIIRNIRPNGFILENELNFEVLIKMVQTVIKARYYYSETISDIAKKSKPYLSILDDLDRRILYCLSVGIKSKNLTRYIPKSLSTLEKRKQKIKEILALNECSDERLVHEANLRAII